MTLNTLMLKHKMERRKSNLSLKKNSSRKISNNNRYLQNKKQNFFSFKICRMPVTQSLNNYIIGCHVALNNYKLKKIILRYNYIKTSKQMPKQQLH